MNRNVIIWHKKDEETGKFKFNHIEDQKDIEYKAYPEPIKPEFILQHAWKNHEWKRSLGYLDSDYKLITLP